MIQIFGNEGLNEDFLLLLLGFNVAYVFSSELASVVELYGQFAFFKYFSARQPK